MGFPSAKIITTDGNLQRLIDSGDVAMLIASDVASIPLMALFNIEEARIKLKSTPILLALAEEYYNEINGKSKLWVCSIVEKSAKELITNHLRQLMKQTSHEVTLIGIATTDSATAAGRVINTEAKDAISVEMKKFGEAMQALNYPVRAFVGAIVDHTDTPFEADFKPREADNPYVGIIVGSSVEDGCGAVGAVLGRACKYPPHEKIGSGKNGALNVENIHCCCQQSIEDRDDIEELHDRGVITFHRRAGRAGYFFGVDWMCTDGDYRYLAHGRIMDKAQRLVAIAAAPYLETHVVMDAQGNIDPSEAAELETVFESAIRQNMGDMISGVKIDVETLQDLINTSNLAVTIKIQPLGYMTWLTITMGLTNSIND